MGIARPLESPAHKIGGLYFNGIDAYVDCGYDESLNITDEITIEAWVKPAQLAVRQGIVDHADGTHGYRLIVSDVDPTRFKIISDYVFDSSVESSSVLVNNEWQHLVGVISGTNGWVYYNGQLVGSGTLPAMQSSAANLIIGKRAYEGSCVVPFNGLISSVRIYNRALSQSEIELLYANPDYPLTDGLVLWFPMNEHSGNTVYDLSPYGNHGTIHNAVWNVRAL
mgnify:CR=1 FL=1